MRQWPHMGGLTLLCCFRVCLIFAVIFFFGCSPKRAEQRNVFTNPILENFFEPQDQEYVKNGMTLDKLQTEMFGTEELAFSLNQLDACQYLDSLPKASKNESRFRLMQFATEDSFDVSQDGMVMSAKGRVDVAANPLFQYALFLENIPSRDDFFDLLRGEKSWEGYALLKTYVTANRHYIDNIFGKFIAGSAKEMPHSFYGFIRDSIFTNTLKGYLPGIFDKDPKFYKFNESIPELILQSGIPSRFAEAKPLNNSHYEKVVYDLEPLTRDTELFRTELWSDYSVDVQKSLRTAIWGLRSQNPRIEACSTFLIHRVLSQYLRLKGIHQPPVRLFENGGQVYSSLPLFKDLISNDTEKPSVKACARPGVFKNSINQRLIIAEDSLAEAELGISVTPRIQIEKNCDLDEALPSKSNEYQQRVKQLTNYETGRLNDWAHLLSGAVEFLSAFNPEAPWWKNLPENVSYPMLSVQELNFKNGPKGVMPLESHQLAAAMILMSSFSLDKYFILFDKNQKRTKTVSETAKIILSENQISTFAPNARLESRIETLVLFVESFLKIYPQLETLREWNKKLKGGLGTPEELKAIERFVNGAFKSKYHLEQVMDTFYEPVADRASDFIYALFLNMGEFLKSEGDRLSCFDELSYTVDSNGVLQNPTRSGQCSVEIQTRVTKLMNLASLYFKAPVFRKISRSLN